MTKHANLAAALIAAQQAFAPITKDNTIRQSGVSKQGKEYNLTYKYADLGSVLEAVTPALHANGLVISQCMDFRDSQPIIKTVLMHADSTETLASHTPIIWADKNDPQKFGGGITYSRRYALMAMLNLNAEDDDGNHARQPAQMRSTASERDETRGQVSGVTTPAHDAVTGEIEPFDEEKEKTAIFRQIYAMSKTLALTDDALKHEMWVAYGGKTPEDEFSRKNMTLDQLTQYRDRMKQKVEAEKKKGAAK